MEQLLLASFCFLFLTGLVMFTVLFRIVFVDNLLILSYIIMISLKNSATLSPS